MATNTQAFIKIEKGSNPELVLIKDFELLIGFEFLQKLQYQPEKLSSKIRSQIEGLYKKGHLSVQQIWFGSYYKSEILHPQIPDIVLKFINPELGWGVFADRDFKKMEMICQYSGILRKSKKEDKTNAYCFEYTLANGIKTPFTIDAQECGGISRFINHSQKPNLQSSLATIDFLNYILLIANKDIKKGEQLCYDYGPDYWSQRQPPVDISKI